MKFLLLNQTFYPDVMATGQYLTEAALRLTERGHLVTVVTSRRAYDQPEMLFPARETWKGIQIHRVGSTGFGKGARWRRAADFASFTVLCALRILLLPRPDVIVALTSPPLISFLGAMLARIRAAWFVYWVMDFNPDEAIAAGWLRAGSLAARVLERMSRFSLRQAKKIIALDRFMRDRVVAKGIPIEKIAVIAPWSQDGVVKFDAEGRRRFREEHGLEGKFVVMYSGNHSPCHPLDTLLQAAAGMGEDVVFCFVGGGSEQKKVGLTATGSDSSRLADRARRIICLPYQPQERLAGSLSAADLHVVVMGEGFVGLVHPCKIYNVLKVGAPVLCIGPRPSHLTEIADSFGEGLHIYSVAHGDVDGVRRAIEEVKSATPARSETGVPLRFARETLLPQVIAVLENP